MYLVMDKSKPLINVNTPINMSEDGEAQKNMYTNKKRNRDAHGLQL